MLSLMNQKKLQQRNLQLTWMLLRRVLQNQRQQRYLQMTRLLIGNPYGANDGSEKHSTKKAGDEKAACVKEEKIAAEPIADELGYTILTMNKDDKNTVMKEGTMQILERQGLKCIKILIGIIMMLNSLVMQISKESTHQILVEGLQVI